MAKASDPREREIVVARTVQGPRRLVFQAYTDPRHLSEWWGPNGFTTTTRAFEFRVEGGKQTLERLSAYVGSIGEKAT